MKARKILSAIMAIAMIAAFAVSASAAEDVTLPDGVTTDSFGDNTVTDGTNYYATITAALAGVHGTDNAVLYCKPGADVGAMTHGHVCKNLTVYGNGAYISGGEQDFEIDYPAASGSSCTGLTGDVTLTVENLTGAGAWGSRTSEYTVNFIFTNCKNMGKVFYMGTTGEVNITMTDCTFTSNDVSNCKVYTQAAGTIILTNVDFSNIEQPVSLGNDSTGTQTIVLTDCDFTNCGASTYDWTVPVSVKSKKAEGSSVLTVNNCTFTGTVTNSVGQNADIILDYGIGTTTANISSTSARVLVETEANVGTVEEITASETKSFTNVESATPVAKIGNVEYTDLQTAINAAEEKDTIELLAGTIEEGSILFPATLNNVTIKGAEEKTTILKNTSLNSANGSAVHYEGITIDGIVFDGSQIVFTGARSGEVVYKDWTITNCEFKNIVSTATSAVHFNLASDEAMENFAFTNNIINGVSGGNISGVRLNYLKGNVTISDNNISNVAWNAVQLINGSVDTFVITNNTLSSGASEGILNLYNVNAEELSISKNKFLVVDGQPGIAYLSSGDVSENYWGGAAPEGLPEGVTYNSYYKDAELTEKVVVATVDPAFGTTLGVARIGANEEDYELVLLGAIDTLNYKDVGFEITLNDEVYELKTKTVYTKITSTDAETNVVTDYTSKELDGAEDGYVFGQMLGFALDDMDKDFTCRLFAINLNDEYIYGKTWTVPVSE